MELATILEALARADAYPHPAGDVQVRHTHISAVFLAGAYAYKIKKPLDLGFLDFTTLEKRRHFCLEEVRLNRRLASGVYLGVLPVVLREGRILVDREGQVVEWCVWMTRLPEEATLARRLADGDLGEDTLRTLGARIASFHSRADSGEAVARYGRWEVVARNAEENFTQSREQLGATVSERVSGRLRARTREALSLLKPWIEKRARRGMTRDTHGDLHLDHIYSFPGKPPPEDLVIVDCIEFNERFRYADPVADMAFLAMDLDFQNRRDLAACFADAYFQASNDAEGRELFPFYKAYRAAVRAKVEGFKAFEPEIPDADKAVARQRARAHWLLALGELEPPRERPCLVLVGGLPATGKSAVARSLALEAGFTRISSDVVRKELAGLKPADSGSAPFGQGIYAPEWNDRTYTECLQRAEDLLFEGSRVVVDASFRDEGKRRQFLDAARRWGVPAVFLLRTAEPEDVRARLAIRSPEASDADWTVYQRAADEWEEPTVETRRTLRVIPRAENKRDALRLALRALSEEGLWGS